MSDKNSVLKKVNEIVSSKFGITPNELTSKCRKQNYVFARMVLACVCNKKYRIRQKDIAEYLKVKQPMISQYLSCAVFELKTNDFFRQKFDEVNIRIKRTEEIKYEKEERDKIILK
nr:helix-turn-helix domain-containing protein [uncultured Chryseobacterium sp.]